MPCCALLLPLPLWVGPEHSFSEFLWDTSQPAMLHSLVYTKRKYQWCMDLHPYTGRQVMVLKVKLCLFDFGQDCCDKQAFCKIPAALATRLAVLHKQRQGDTNTGFAALNSKCWLQNQQRLSCTMSAEICSLQRENKQVAYHAYQVALQKSAWQTLTCFMHTTSPDWQPS